MNRRSFLSALFGTPFIGPLMLKIVPSSWRPQAQPSVSVPANTFLWTMTRFSQKPDGTYDLIDVGYYEQRNDGTFHLMPTQATTAADHQP